MGYGDHELKEILGGPHCYSYVCVECGNELYPPRKPDAEQWCDQCKAWRLTDVRWNCRGAQHNNVN